MTDSPTRVGAPVRDAATDTAPDDFTPMRHPEGHPEAWMHAEVDTPEYLAAVAALRENGAP